MDGTVSSLSQRMAVKAVFFDRDGTLIQHRPYLASPDEVVILPGVVEALHALKKHGAKLFLFTNQSGVGRGYLTLEDVHIVNRKMIEMIGLGDDLFTDICVATERPDEPVVYRKPSPRFINEMLALHGIERHCAWMIGDGPADWQAAVHAGVGAAAIVTDPEPEPERASRAAAGVKSYVSVIEWMRTISG